MAGPNMLKVRGFNIPQNLETHLLDSLRKAATEHSTNWKSWGKTRLRKGNLGETTVGAVGQGGAALAGTSGGAALLGAAVPAAAVGVGAGVAAAAITLYALPVIAAGAVTAYWAYNKHDHHKVNQEIWEWWNKYWAGTGENVPKEPVKLEQAKTWLAWFGDEGIFNMTQLEAKLKAAKEAFDHQFNSINTSAQGLRSRISAAQKLSVQQKNLALVPLRQEAETLASKFLELGKDLEYIEYRLQRNLMYRQMLEHTIRTLVSYMKETPMLAADMAKAYIGQLDCYLKLKDYIANMPEV